MIRTHKEESVAISLAVVGKGDRMVKWQTPREVDGRTERKERDCQNKARDKGNGNMRRN